MAGLSFATRTLMAKKSSTCSGLKLAGRNARSVPSAFEWVDVQCWQCRRVHATTVSLNRRLNCTDRMICRADERDDSCCSRGPVAAPVNTGILRPALPFTGPAFQPTSAALSSMGISAAASQCMTVHAVVTRLSIARAPVVPECCAATADGRWTCRGPWPTVDKPLTMIGSLPEARQKCFSTGTLTPHCASHRPEP